MTAAVVIGAGAGGLAVAARLRAAGLDVDVFEQSATAGGKLAGYEREGFVFDTGPSLLTLPAVYRDLFLKTGRPIERELRLRPVDPAFHYRFADGTEVDLPNASRAGAASAMGTAFGEDAGDRWSRLIERGGDVWDLTRNSFLGAAANDAGSMARLMRRWGDIRTVAPFTSLRDLGGQYLRDPRQRQLFERYATYSGSDPRQAPAALVTIPYVEQAFGAWHVEGGVHRLAGAMVDRLTGSGGRIHLQSSVSEILTEGARVSGVTLADGTRVAADVVVSDVDAAHLYGDLIPGAVGHGARRDIARADRSLAGFVMLLALSGRSKAPRHHTVLFGPDYDDEFDAIFGRGRPASAPADPTIYICSPEDDLMRPDDGEAWFVLVNVPPHGDPDADPTTVNWEDQSTVHEYATRVLDTMAARGWDVRDRLLWFETRTPADLEQDTRSPGGSIYGTASHGALAPFRRPRNVSPLPGLYLVGGSAHPGGGLPLVALSAETVASLITSPH